MDNQPRFVVLPTAMGYRSLDVLPERFSSRIKLTCPTPYAQAGSTKAQPGITPFAQVAEIAGRIIGFIVVPMIHDEKTARPAQITPFWSWRNTLLCPVAMRPIGDGVR